jgi:hypothetical protein
MINSFRFTPAAPIFTCVAVGRNQFKIGSQDRRFTGYFDVTHKRRVVFFFIAIFMSENCDGKIKGRYEYLWIKWFFTR